MSLISDSDSRHSFLGHLRDLVPEAEMRHKISVYFSLAKIHILVGLLFFIFVIVDIIISSDTTPLK